MPERVSFYSLFRQNADGSITPLRNVRIGGIQFGPGVQFSGGVSFGGVNLFDYLGKDFQVEWQNGIAVITGIYGD